MSSYEIEQKIFSCFVSLSLLKELEKYLIEQGDQLYSGKNSPNYSVTIYDKYGKEHIESFDNYHRITLPNQARRVELSVGGHYQSSFLIEVSFSKEPTFSFIRVEMSGSSAKERASGILEAIKTHIKEHKNLNFLFYGTHVFIISMIPTVAIGVFIGGIQKNIGADTVVSGFLIIVGIIFLSLRLVNPYCVLDTKRNKSIASAVKWILNGLAGVFLFGLLAEYIRKYFFSF